MQRALHSPQQESLVSRAIPSRPLVTMMLAVVATTVACINAAERPADEASQALTGIATPDASRDGRGIALGAGAAANASPRERLPEKAASRPPQSPVRTQNPTLAMIIRNGDVLVEVDSVEIAIARVRQLAASLGGYLGNVSVTVGERQVRSASLELKVPAARFDEAMSGMTPLGKVERSNATAEDVGEEFVDITARMSNSRRLEARLVTLLEQRTGKLEDVLTVERELARVREEIERYEGRIRYLSSRAATSTIVATVHEKAPIIAASPGTNVIGQAFLNMWRNFVGFLAVVIESLGVLLPIAAIAWLGFWVWKRRRVIPAPTA